MRTGVLAAMALMLLVSTGCPPCSGPNPKADEIQYGAVVPIGGGPKYARITGIVTNVGMLPFRSRQGQQTVGLYEGDNLVAEKEFTDLGVDESVEVRYERNWSLSDEFRPPSYTLRITYDPDIYMDGNEENDDCNQGNNTLSRSTAALDALFED